METKLTLKYLKEIKPGTIFKSGITNDPRLVRNMDLRWVAVRGIIHDWAIYYHKITNSNEMIAKEGDKCFMEEVIKELVPCDEEAYKMYRY